MTGIAASYTRQRLRSRRGWESRPSTTTEDTAEDTTDKMKRRVCDVAVSEMAKARIKAAVEAVGAGAALVQVDVSSTRVPGGSRLYNHSKLHGP